MTRTYIVSAGRAAVLVLALTCLVAVPSMAAAQTDISGTWEVSMTTPQGPTTVDVAFKQQGEAVTGELTSPLGVAPFKGTLVGDALSIVAAIDVQGTALQLTFNAKVTNISLAGTVKFGDLGEAPFEGKRKAGAAATPAAAARPTPAPSPAAGSSIAGDWNLSINVQGNDVLFLASFTQEGTKVDGRFSGDPGTFPVSGSFADNALKLDFVAVTTAGNMNVAMTGTLGASGLAGRMTIEGLGDADWTGTRK